MNHDTRSTARGMAALTVVMILFFVMAMVAAYTNRNLIFEQRISANTYRANKALDAADAGVEWTVAMLNGGRVNTACLPSTDVANSDFRRLYLADASDADPNGAGGYSLSWGADRSNRLFPACINRDGALSCICPTAATRNPDIGAPADGIGSAFSVSFILPGNAVRPGAVQFATRGCASPGTGGTACFAQTSNTPTVDALAGALSTVGLVRALPLAPIAALTAGTTIDATAGELQIGNGDPSRGLTAHAGTAINLNGAGDNLFTGPAGSGSDGKLVDASLSQLSAGANEAWFRAMFGVPAATFQRQPAVIRVNCATGCQLSALTSTLAGYPRNPIWVNGNLDIDAAADLGSNLDPLMLVVNGTLTVSAGARITGFVHANGITWSAASAWVKGAMVSSTTFTATSRATLIYDRPVLDTIRLRYGSFVRVPGSWNLTTVF